MRCCFLFYASKHCGKFRNSSLTLNGKAVWKYLSSPRKGQNSKYWSGQINGLLCNDFRTFHDQHLSFEGKASRYCSLIAMGTKRRGWCWNWKHELWKVWINLLLAVVNEDVESARERFHNLRREHIMALMTNKALLKFLRTDQGSLCY